MKKNVRSCPHIRERSTLLWRGSFMQEFLLQRINVSPTIISIQLRHQYYSIEMQVDTSTKLLNFKRMNTKKIIKTCLLYLLCSYIFLAISKLIISVTKSRHGLSCNHKVAPVYSLFFFGLFLPLVRAVFGGDKRELIFVMPRAVASQKIWLSILMSFELTNNIEENSAANKILGYLDTWLFCYQNVCNKIKLLIKLKRIPRGFTIIKTTSLQTAKGPPRYVQSSQCDSRKDPQNVEYQTFVVLCKKILKGRVDFPSDLHEPISENKTTNKYARLRKSRHINTSLVFYIPSLPGCNRS